MTDETPAPPERLSFIAAMLRVSPPWLRRMIGGAIMQGLGTPIEGEVDRNVAGLRMRFPGGGADEDALGYTGRERRILRGPGELAETYAIRLRKWWDSHRIRGNAYALLDQMHAYFLATNPGLEIVYVANTGTADARVDTAGVITRGGNVMPGWTGDGEVPPQWARFWLFLELPGDTFNTVLVDENGDPIVDEAGEAILVAISIYALGPEELAEICAVPHEWSAAHIDRIYIGIIPPDGILWGYPASLTWGEPGRTWGGDLSVRFTC
jgi:hypothetical protein